jgi:hypothetical protein
MRIAKGWKRGSTTRQRTRPTCWARSHPLWNTVIFASMESSWPKTDYICPPPLSSDFTTGQRRNKIHNTDLQTARIRGEMLPEPFLVAPSTPSTLSSSASWWRRSSSPPELWYCGSNLYQTLACASMIWVTWPAYHDCDHIYIISMVDLLFMRWFMRYKDVLLSDVWVDVYLIPFLYVFLSN